MVGYFAEGDVARVGDVAPRELVEFTNVEHQRPVIEDSLGFGSVDVADVGYGVSSSWAPTCGARLVRIYP